MAVSKAKVVGYLSLIVGILTRETATGAAQSLQKVIPDIQLSVFRLIALATVTGAYIFIIHGCFSIQKRQYVQFFIMTLAENFGSLLYFAGAAYLPMSHVVGFNMGSKIIFVTIFMKVRYARTIGFLTIIAIFVSLGGLVLQMEPWKAFSDGFLPDFMKRQYQGDTTTFLFNQSGGIGNGTEIIPQSKIDLGSIVLIGHSLVFVSAFFEVLFMTMAGEDLKEIHPTVIIFVSALIRLPLSLILMLYLEEPVIVLHTDNILIIILHCVCNVMAATFTITSYQLLPLVEVSIMESFETVISLVPQYTIFKHHLGGWMNVTEVVGSVLIVIALVLSTLASFLYNDDNF